ncbi:MAG: hypothetical protein HFJ52_04185 [Clostridia bacterium]|jgi:hypothetical protein|nr:hypothetical protein [Clostridia bacterium]
MKSKYTLNAHENCSTCEHCNTQSKDFPYICSLTDEHTGMFIKCKTWQKKENK